MVAGVLGIVEGLTLLPVLWHGLVLVVFPATVERICVVLSLGGGAASLIFTFSNNGQESSELQPDALATGS
jgi:hypothetical protein